MKAFAQFWVPNCKHFCVSRLWCRNCWYFLNCSN